MSGNGPDLAQIVAMLGTVLSGQNEMRAQLRAMERRLSDVESGLKELRQAVTAYHASVMGHGILISELEARVQRIEAHLNLSA